MRELLRTNDLVFLSWVQAVLSGEGIEAAVLDSHMSVLEGSTFAIPRRVMVADDDLEQAHWILTQAGEASRLSRR